MIKILWHQLEQEVEITLHAFSSTEKSIQMRIQ